MYKVSANIRYLDGVLAGLVIPAGLTMSFPLEGLAHGAACVLTEKCSAGTAIRAIGGGVYVIDGGVTVTPVLPIGAAEYGACVRALEADGLTTSDAQGVVDGRILTASRS